MNSESQTSKAPFHDRLIVKIALAAWPILLVFLPIFPQVQNAFGNFYKYVTEPKTPGIIYEVEWCTASLPIITAIWFAIFLIQSNKKEKEHQKDRKEIGQLLKTVGVYNPEILGMNQVYHQSIYPVFSKLERYDAEFASGQFDNIEKIQEAFKEAAQIFKETVQQVFDLKKVGLNIMLFFDSDEDRDLVLRLMEGEILGSPNQMKNHLRGVLYLSKKLNQPLLEKKENYELTIPIYSLDRENKYEFDRSLTMPGAPHAFFNGYSVIDYTRAKTIYEHIDKDLVTKMTDHFQEKDTTTLSIISYGIFERYLPSHPNIQGDCVAIINIEAQDMDVFSKNEYCKRMQFGLYSLITPTFQTAIKYLKYYKTYLKTTC